MLGRSDMMTPTTLLSTLEKLISEIEQNSILTSRILNQVKEILGHFPDKLSYDEKLQAWKLSYRIWNTCVDLANNKEANDEVDEDHATLRQSASDLLFSAGTIEGVESCLLKIATFYYRTGNIWHKLKNYGQASVCFEKATEIISRSQQESEGTAQVKDKEEQQFQFDLFLARSRTAWELNHRALVSSLLARARNLLGVFPQKCQRLAEHFFRLGKELILEDDKESQSESIKYLEQAFEVCSESRKDSLEESERNSLSTLKLQILRYLAAGHLQKENYLSVLKCVSVLKLGTIHPSTQYLAVKALAALGRYEEAEAELFALIRQNNASVEACLSALELVLQDSSRLEGGKRAFFAIMSVHESNQMIPLRMLEYLLKPTAVSDSYHIKRVELSLDIAVNSNVFTLLTAKTPSDHSSIDADGLCNKAQECTHALLWNRYSDLLKKYWTYSTLQRKHRPRQVYFRRPETLILSRDNVFLPQTCSGAEHFTTKKYEISIKLFEASMLYLPGDGENNVQRAKALRVLCLCHLALLQYDRAVEFAIEAQKIEPNIASAFLKFKIYLHTNKEVEAIEEVENMLNCSDFQPDFLTLASHEAMTQNSAVAATTALSKLLSLQLEKRNTDTKEVVLFRNLIHLSLQNPSSLKEAIKYIKQAQAQLTEAGFESFFGSGSVAKQEAKWFASTSWNQGLQAIQAHDWQLSADMLACASEFISSLEETQENLQWLQKSLLLATSSLLAADSGVDCLRQATKMMDKCRKVQRALAMGTESANAVDNTLEVHTNLVCFDLKGRVKDSKAQLDILYHCSTLSDFKADYYLMMTNYASKEGQRCLDVATTASRLALKFMLGSSTPDYELVAMTMRKQIKLLDQQNKDGPEVLAMYRQSREILASLSAGEYPPDEAQWLAATSWNRAGLHLKFLRYAEAESWMEIALDLLKYAPQLEHRKEAMVEGLNHVRQKKAYSLTNSV